MKCKKCGYEGLAEIGNFPDERFEGKYKNLPYMNVPFRCPKCKTNKDMAHINGYDSIAKLIKIPEKDKVLIFYFGGASKNLVGYSIRNLRYPDSSMGSAITIEEFEMLKKEFPNYIFVGLNVDEINLSKLLK